MKAKSGKTVMVVVEYIEDAMMVLETGKAVTENMISLKLLQINLMENMIMEKNSQIQGMENGI